MKYKCKKCKKTFDNKNKLGGHSSSHYRYIGMKNKSMKKEFFCKNCNKKIIKDIRSKRLFCSLKCSGEFKSKYFKEIRLNKTRFNKSISFLQDYSSMIKECEICGKPESIGEKGKIRNLAFDHDHETNEFRGMLCFACNIRFDWFIINNVTINEYRLKKLP